MTRMPLVVETSRLATDSGGAGTTRGGLSMQRSMRVLAPDSRYSLLSDGAVVPAFGVMGGLSGVQVGGMDRAGQALSKRFDTPGQDRWTSGGQRQRSSSCDRRVAEASGDPLLRAP